MCLGVWSFVGEVSERVGEGTGQIEDLRSLFKRGIYTLIWNVLDKFHSLLLPNLSGSVLLFEHFISILNVLVLFAFVSGEKVWELRAILRKRRRVDTWLNSE